MSTDVATPTSEETQIPDTPRKSGTFGLPTATAPVIGSLIGTVVPYIFSAGAQLYWWLTRGRETHWAHLVRNCGVSAPALALALVLSFWSLAGSGYQAVYYGVSCLLLGLPIYIWLKVGRREYGETAVVPVEAATLARTP